MCTHIINKVQIKKPFNHGGHFQHSIHSAPLQFRLLQAHVHCHICLPLTNSFTIFQKTAVIQFGKSWILIKWSKIDLFHWGVDLFVGRTGTDICPAVAMLNYLVIRGMALGPMKDRTFLSLSWWWKFEEGLRGTRNRAVQILWTQFLHLGSNSSTR